MPWTNQGGNNNGGNGPWSRGPSSGGGAPGTPPDLEELLRRSQHRLRSLLPGGGFTAGTIGVVLLLVIAVWLASGIYIVRTSEQGVVLRFGALVDRTSAGMHYHWPWPIETAYLADVTSRRQISIGYHPGNTDDNATGEEDPNESLMLTGDENIIDVNFTVYWVVNDAPSYLFHVANPDDAPDATIKAVAESAMREVVGQNQIDPILTQDRAPIEAQVRDLMQQTLDGYGAGVLITQVKMQKADIPPEVIDAYRDVQAARADQERMRNEAEAYANKIIPEARGNAAKIVQDAQAYKQKVIAEASGEAARFTYVYQQYKSAPEVTRRRMYLETMSQVLGGANKVIMDDSANRGVVPYLPLPALKPKATP
ncbi:MAG TPA: FtsH protease activity modulator HflK [Rhizomicrobium sp.]|nr:FtsH protease activity modulator HflK [Rhizomicrobium sp.]